MWIRRIALVAALVFGVGFGFGLASCVVPPVEGQVMGFPPLTVGAEYQVEFSPAAVFPESELTTGIITEVGPYPWIEMENGEGFRIHVNVDNVAFIAIRSI